MKRLMVAVLGLAVTLIAGAGPAAAATTGSQTFFIVQQGQNSTLTAFGPVSGSGRDVVLSDTQDRFVFDGGSVLVSHHPTASHDTFSPSTCIGRFTERGTYQLTGGTGKYAGASGGGTYRVDAMFQGRHTANGCSDDGPTTVMITTNGRTTLP